MEPWKFDFKWLKVRHRIKDAVGRDTLPDLNAILLLIGVQELGHIQTKFTKEEKQDLMHIAVCRLLSYDGYYAFQGIDADGWPHWTAAKPLKIKGVSEQEQMLKEKIIQYFSNLDEEE